jgi:ornithine decarboxylase
LTPGQPAIDPDRIRDLAAQHGAPVLLLDTGVVRDQYRALRAALPGVIPHYALKPLPHPAVVAALDDEGCAFDVCSNGEVDVVAAQGIAPDRCIHTHPIKRPSDIAHALAFGIDTFVVDNGFELDKFLPYADRVRLLVRLSFRAPEAVVDLSYKFGVQPQDGLALIRAAKTKGLTVAGLAFHVGSQCTNTAKYLEAIAFCRKLFSLAALDGIILDTLDIGGGFPVPYLEAVPAIGEFCAPIRSELERNFPGIRLICEPGRFISAPAMTLVASVMGKADRAGVRWYYLDDGLYGSWSGKLYDHCEYPLFSLRELSGDAGPTRPSVVAGPTCDSIDVVAENIPLPDLEPGDLLVTLMMGAYTHASATEFNFFPKTPIIEVSP